MATSARNHTVPAPLETPRRQAINDALASVNDIVPVANVTERAQLLADLGWTPSAARPLVISRADAPSGAQFEYTVGETSGSTVLWRTWSGESAPVVPTLASGWSTVSGAGHALLIRRIGNWAYLTGSVQRTTGSTGSILQIPAAMQPPTADTRPVGVVVASNATFGVMFIGSGELKASAGYGNLAGSGTFVLPLSGLMWPLT